MPICYLETLTSKAQAYFLYSLRFCVWKEGRGCIDRVCVSIFDTRIDRVCVSIFDTRILPVCLIFFVPITMLG
jgi:hypothetical protein